MGSCRHSHLSCLKRTTNVMVMVWLFHWWGNVRRAKAAEKSQLIFTFNIALWNSKPNLAGQEFMWPTENRAQIQTYICVMYLNGQNVKAVDGVCESIDDFIIFSNKGSYKRTLIIYCLILYSYIILEKKNSGAHRRMISFSGLTHYTLGMCLKNMNYSTDNWLHVPNVLTTVAPKCT